MNVTLTDEGYTLDGKWRCEACAILPCSCK